MWTWSALRCCSKVTDGFRMSFELLSALAVSSSFRNSFTSGSQIANTFVQNVDSSVLTLVAYRKSWAHTTKFSRYKIVGHLVFAAPLHSACNVSLKQVQLPGQPELASLCTIAFRCCWSHLVFSPKSGTLPQWFLNSSQSHAKIKVVFVNGDCFHCKYRDFTNAGTCMLILVHVHSPISM